MGGHVDAPPPEAKPRQGGPEVSTQSLFRLDRRSIIVTGGIGGIGTKATEAILQSGGDAVILDRYEKPLQDVWNFWQDALDACAKSNGSSILYRSCDVTSEESVRQALGTLREELRHPIRGLLACVGQSDTGPSITYPPNDFRRLLEINVMATFIAAQAVARAMQGADHSGSMVLIASMSGHVVNQGADSSAYNSAKSAVLQLGRSLASEWGARRDMPLIRVNTLSPGYVRTAATEDALKHDDMEARWNGQNMLHRLCFPDELRGPIIYLLSDASSFMTATDLRIDGGHCAW
ncbi:uncharacterized protein PV07_12508 [Cladophialophora immunda]|uniref:Uncharacterized protein n=1 Tax=Cladophialophora immunda TaxID=569365 RepID=A0A0D1Z382_9EURO|nr:uncharacterized protein PV07_12508 [Cladophialophora immunda]KIW22091.1 hypothetical protein PV07_12508 [Cladophialophora immunda]